MSFIILKRIAKNSNYYILKVYDTNNKKIVYKYLERDSNKIIDREKVKNFDFRDFETDKKFNLEDINFDSSEKVNINSLFKVHRFDSSEPGLRKYNYTLMSRDGKELFAPCCGKHERHNDLKTWGKYKDDYEFFDYKISGYLITDKRSFDLYHLDINDKMLNIRFIGESDILIREFFDYLGIDGVIDSLSKEKDREYILKIK